MRARTDGQKGDITIPLASASSQVSETLFWPELCGLLGFPSSSQRGDFKDIMLLRL